MSNYRFLINMNYRGKFIVNIIVIILLLTFILSLLIESYDSYHVYGVFNNHHLMVNIPLDNSDEVTKGNNLIISDEKYKYTITDVSEYLVENNVNYQVYELYVPKLKLKDNQVISVTFYYNREKIIKKISRLIF